MNFRKIEFRRLLRPRGSVRTTLATFLASMRRPECPRWPRVDLPRSLRSPTRLTSSSQIDENQWNSIDFHWITLILSLLICSMQICSVSYRPPTLRTYLTHFEDDDRHKNWWPARREYKLMDKNPQLWHLALFLSKFKKCWKLRVYNSELFDSLKVWFL